MKQSNQSTSKKWMAIASISASLFGASAPRAQAVSGLVTLQPGLVALGGFAMASGIILIASPRGTATERVVRGLFFGVPLFLAGMFVLPDHSNIEQFTMPAQSALDIARVPANDPRLRDYRHDLAKLNQIVGDIQEHVAQLGSHATNDDALAVARQDWMDYRPQVGAPGRLKPGTWSLIQQLTSRQN